MFGLSFPDHSSQYRNNQKFKNAQMNNGGVPYWKMNTPPQSKKSNIMPLSNSGKAANGKAEPKTSWLA